MITPSSHISLLTKLDSAQAISCSSRPNRVRVLQFLATLVLSLLALDASAQPEVSDAARQRLYLSAGNAIDTFSVDPANGKLTLLESLSLPGAGPLGISPDRTRLYASCVLPGTNQNSREPALATLEIAPDGRLSLRHRAPINFGAGYLMCDATGRFVAGNHYGPGRASIWKLDENGDYKAELAAELLLEQRAHSAVFAPGNRFLLVPATGPNKVFVNRFFADTGSAKPHQPPFASGPAKDSQARQPRHLVFHPEKPLAYTTLERENPGVGVWRWDPDKGTLEVIQDIVTRPEGFEGTITTADLHLTPDARFLYVSNRDVTDRKATQGTNHIVGFAVDSEKGTLTYLGHTPCEHIPRSFTIDVTGRYLYVAGQGDDRLGVYAIDPESGALTKVEQHQTGLRPSWVTCLVPGEG